MLFTHFYFLPLLLLKSNRINLGGSEESTGLPSINEFLRIISTFGLVCIAWVFFRADSLTIAFNYLKRIVVNPFQFSIQSYTATGYKLSEFVMLLFFLSVMVIIEWRNKNNDFGLKCVHDSMLVRRVVYYGLLLAVLFHFSSDRSFIYFQF